MFQVALVIFTLSLSGNPDTSRFAMDDLNVCMRNAFLLLSQTDLDESGFKVLGAACIIEKVPENSPVN